MTAVAVCRNKCKDKILSTYYFEFGNGDRKLKSEPGNDFTDHDYRDHYDNGMGRWHAAGGTTN
jgi:hypothetical protein